MKKKDNKPKDYVCITKIGNNEDGTAKCVKFRTSDLLNFTGFLDTDYPTWVWMKVYCNIGAQKGSQLGYFTRANRPTERKITI
jgi:hypothetical protein